MEHQDLVSGRLGWTELTTPEQLVRDEPPALPIVDETAADERRRIVPGRVVLVDDNADMRAYLTHLLAKHWTVHAVANGSDALEAARQYEPDVVLTDVMMPGLDGFALLRSLRADARTAEVRVIILSARSSADARVEGLQLGADDYLAKPFSARELVARVNSQVTLSQHHRERAVLLEGEQAARREAELQKENLRVLNDELERRVVERTGALTKAYGDLEWRDRKIRRLVNANIVGVLVANLEDGRIIEANDAFLNMLGYSREDLALPLRWTELTPPDWKAATERAVAQIAAQGVCDLFEKEYVRKDGSRVPVLVAAAAIEGTKGENVAFVLDLTERKRAEAAQTRAQAELQQARNALAHRQRVSMFGEVAASLAHEIKQPIAAAQLDARICVRALTEDRFNLELARKAAARLVKEAMMADEIIDRTTALYKKDAMRRAPVNVGTLIRETALLLQQEATASAVSIQTKVAEGTPDIMADRVQVQQVLMNLMLNSIDAMKDSGGDLTIASHMSEDHELLVSVSDTGVGLPTGNPEQIFESFVTTKAHGTGMGLAISRSIVEAHGGRLSAMPNSLRGATFMFTLPSEAE